MSRQMLTAAQASQALGISARELSELIAARWLRPRGSDAACYPVRQVEALLNTPGGVPPDLRSGFLQALGQTLAARLGPPLDCQLRRSGQHLHLRIRPAGDTQLLVWLVPTSAGWRFFWRRYRSHAAFDLPGAATAIIGDLGLITQRVRPAVTPARHSADHSSMTRKRALRRLAREQSTAYTALYQRIRPGAPSHTHARNQAWTKLRYQYPHRYRELYDEERPQAAKPPRLTGTGAVGVAGVSRSGRPSEREASR
jgi:hypothetical protein